jgi:hypothetical protein
MSNVIKDWRNGNLVAHWNDHFFDPDDRIHAAAAEHRHVVIRYHWMHANSRPSRWGALAGHTAGVRIA